MAERYKSYSRAKGQQFKSRSFQRKLANKIEVLACKNVEYRRARITLHHHPSTLKTLKPFCVQAIELVDSNEDDFLVKKNCNNN